MSGRETEAATSQPSVRLTGPFQEFIPSYGAIARGSRDFPRGGGLKSAMQIWRRFWRMSGYARGHVLEAAGGLLLTRAGLAVAGFRRWKAAIEWLTRATTAPGSRAAQPAVEFARAVERWQAAAARHLPLRTNCLDRAVTLWWLLRRRGIAAELCIGARKEDGRFEAHAWVEVGGAVIDDPGRGRGEFSEFARSIGAIETDAS